MVLKNSSHGVVYGSKSIYDHIILLDDFHPRNTLVGLAWAT